MQLDPARSLVGQISAIGGNDVQRLTAAACASVGYTVFTNVVIDLSGDPAAEADVFAALFTPLRESRVVIECKGGNPSFNEIRKFSSFEQLLSPRPDEMLFVARPNCPPNRHELAHLLGLRIVERTNLAYYALPLLSGADLRHERAVVLNRFLAWQDVDAFFVRQARNIEAVRQHYRFLTHKLWCVGPTDQQVLRSFEAYTNHHARSWATVVAQKGLRERDALYYANDDDFEAAMYVVLIHRLMNAYAVTRRTLEVVRHETPQELVETTGPALRAAISELSSHPRHLFGFPSFLQRFFFVWGGFIVEENKDTEIEHMAREAGTSTDAVKHYLNVLDLLYQSGGRGLFQEWNGLRYFKYVPGALRALGFLHREAIDPELYANKEFFGKSGKRYRTALERALVDTGGTAALRY